MKESTRGKIAIVLAALLWGFGTLILRWTNTIHSIPTILFGNFVPAVIVFYFLNRYKKINLFPKKQYWKWMIVLGITNSITVLTIIYAFVLTSIAKAEFLHYTMPIWAFLIAVFWLKEKITRWKLLALVLALLGIALIFNVSSLSQGFLGNLLALVSAFSYAVSINVGRRVKDNPQENTSFWMQGFSLVPIALFFVFSNTFSHWRDIPLFLGYSLIVTIIPTLLFFYGLRKTEASTGSILLLLEALTASVLAWIFLRESLTSLSIIGGILIVFSSVVLIKSRK